ncbi:MAG: hypothetical protein JO119_07885 [Acidobacteria bacterium]|nr:hypothetical protein [Acidobacteriota bacterium]
MKHSLRMFVPFLVLLGCVSPVFAQSDAAVEGRVALPFPTRDTPKPIDRGAFSSESPLTVTVALRLRNSEEAEALLTAVHTPGNAKFHQFLSPEQFEERFGPTPADVAKVIAHFSKLGLSAQRSTSTTLTVTGSATAFERAFNVTLHSFEVPAHRRNMGYTFHAPLTRPTVPGEISSAVMAVVGLDTHPSLHPRHEFALKTMPRLHPTKNAGTTTNPPGLLTTADFGQYYDVQPLYNQNITGAGRTVGIVTLAAFTPADAFAYWSFVGLSVNPNRIKTVNVYQAPNTNQGYVDAFARAVESTPPTASPQVGDSGSSIKAPNSRPSPILRPGEPLARCRRYTNSSCAPLFRGNRSSPLPAMAAPSTSIATCNAIRRRLRPAPLLSRSIARPATQRSRPLVALRFRACWSFA